MRGRPLRVGLGVRAGDRGVLRLRPLGALKGDLPLRVTPRRRLLLGVCAGGGVHVGTSGVVALGDLLVVVRRPAAMSVWAADAAACTGAVCSSRAMIAVVSSGGSTGAATGAAGAPPGSSAVSVSGGTLG